MTFTLPVISSSELSELRSPSMVIFKERLLSNMDGMLLYGKVSIAAKTSLQDSQDGAGDSSVDPARSNEA